MENQHNVATNPFEIINSRLYNIELILKELSLNKGPEIVVEQGIKFLGVKEASKLLGLKPGTVYRNCNSGLIPSIKKGGRLTFIEEELINWLKSGRRKTHHDVQNAAEVYVLNNENIKRVKR